MHEMKDSGIEWIGEIPTHYDALPIGSLFSVKKDIIGHEPDTVLSITQTGIRPKDLSSNEGQNASSYAHYQIVNTGDFAMNHMDLLTGWIDISKYDGVTSPDYRVFTINDKRMSAEYFLRVFQHYYANRVFFGFGQGVATLGRWRLPAVNFKKIYVPVPPIDEQHDIVRAIDDSVGKVDALIANVQAQIERLKAYKQSVITEVVTKGLDPSVSMKDSGVEWIGEIPEHWKVSKLKNLAKIQTGSTPTKSEQSLYYNSEYGIPWIKAENLGSNASICETSEYLTEMGAEAGRVFPKNTVFICCIASVGKVGFSEVACSCNQQINGVFFNDRMHWKYGFYMSLAQEEVYMVYSSGNVMKIINSERQSNIPCVVPPVREQLSAVAFLDDKCDQIDQLIAIKQKKIDKLHEYKKSLIYEFVTGKREA